MSRSKKIVSLAIAAAATLLVACGDDDGDPVSAGSYASDICTAFTDWRDSVQEREGDLRKGLEPGISPAEGKEALEGFMSDVSDRSDQLVEDVEAAGVPDAENGEEVADALAGAAEEARDKIAEAEEKAGELPTDSKESFDQAADEFGSDIKTALGSVGDGLQEMDSAEVEKAFNEEEACNS